LSNQLLYHLVEPSHRGIFACVTEGFKLFIPCLAKSDGHFLVEDRRIAVTFFIGPTDAFFTDHDIASTVDRSVENSQIRSYRPTATIGSRAWVFSDLETKMLPTVHFTGQQSTGALGTDP